jgi:hypothetical protein
LRRSAAYSLCAIASGLDGSMPVEHDSRVREFGTKVRLFPKPPFLAGFDQPEVVWLSPPAGTVAPGPSDDRMFVRDALEKPEPYDFPYLPPYTGRCSPPVEQGPGGHFDHLPIDSRDFVAVHLYGSLRRVLDIFESYFGRRLEWQFRDRYQRLELIPLLDWENAQSGYGYMEFGYSTDDTGKRQPFALNFDVIAHEMGHSILFSTMDLPVQGHWTTEFGGFHESSADLVALISAMHFDTLIDRLLHTTKGNLYTLNELNRIGELSDSRQIRIVSNSRKMSEVTDEVHDLSRPLTGAIFDFIVYVYLEELLRRGLVNVGLRDEALTVGPKQKGLDRVQRQFDRAYVNRHFQFKAALAQARDVVGARLAETWQTLSPNDLSYEDVAAAFLVADRRQGGGQYQAELRNIFHWREIYETVTPVYF